MPQIKIIIMNKFLSFILCIVSFQSLTAQNIFFDVTLSPTKSFEFLPSERKVSMIQESTFPFGIAGNFQFQFLTPGEAFPQPLPGVKINRIGKFYNLTYDLLSNPVDTPLLVILKDGIKDAGQMSFDRKFEERFILRLISPNQKLQLTPNKPSLG